MIDALNYFAPTFPFAQENHLVSPNNPLYCILEPGRIWYPKQTGTARMPADMNTYDETFVYQKLTENSAIPWNSPAAASAFKSFVSSNWSGGGIPLGPRYLIDDTSRSYGPWITKDSSFKLFTTCAASTQSNLGQVQTEALGPFTVELGGDLGTLPCVIVEYQWNNGAILETFTFAESYGWVGWTTSNLVNGIYVVQQSNVFNTIASGGSASYMPFPCQIP